MRAPSVWLGHLEPSHCTAHATRVTTWDDPTSCPDKYCKFAVVWNDNINSTDVKLSPKMLDCGCFWVSEVTAEVGKCPGVDLG
jgi:hypothetical protein